ncbi:MAG TPA: phosphatidate cytidylyltransferase, partial [Candidatus Marinimicrobia bacterium]|nr:phosphatidate cytidylyltransferase [Candidatus Neomarinimicrobiota bacterium]
FYIILLLYAALAICDTLAYFFGTAYGKTKLAPSISPNKSWEGAIAGFMGSIFVVLIAWKYDMIPFLNLGNYLVLGLITGIIGQIGDLFESRLKREVGVKDSSGFLFGHGGFLDRFDSLAFAAPLFWVYLHIAVGSLK